jgi:hypothetical protein
VVRWSGGAIGGRYADLAIPDTNVPASPKDMNGLLGAACGLPKLHATTDGFLPGEIAYYIQTALMAGWRTTSSPAEWSRSSAPSLAQTAANTNAWFDEMDGVTAGWTIAAPFSRSSATLREGGSGDLCDYKGAQVQRCRARGRGMRMVGPS